MEGEARRKKLLQILKKGKEPVSGKALSGMLGVSRQVIVQDIALLRANGQHIISTNQGYLLGSNPKDPEFSSIRVFRVNHRDEDILDELQTIVDLGGRVLNVFVEHEVYGEITVELVIRSRLDAREFVDQLLKAGDRPLKTLTNGAHYHTVAAPSEKHLDAIGAALQSKGYLQPEN